MNITNKTVLVTGGGSGIGFEIAGALSEKGNNVIITGRNEERLKEAASRLKNVSFIATDITSGSSVDTLVAHVKNVFGKIDVLINNAGAAYAYQLATEADTFTKAKTEFETNFFSILRLTDQFLPLLKEQDEAAIINVSSVLAFVPSSAISTYSASKAALHSYTQSLRYALQNTGVKVFELMQPLVNTAFSKDIGGEKGIHPKQVADELVAALENDIYEVRVGNTEQVYRLSLASPADAFKAVNQDRQAE